MRDAARADVANLGERVTAEVFETFDDFALLCCHQPHTSLLSDPESFSVTRRSGRIGPLTLSELIVDFDMAMDFGECWDTYYVHMLQAGRAESIHRGRTFDAGVGSASVYTPAYAGAARWAAGNRMICLKVDRCAVDEVRRDALGGAVMPRPDFPSIMAITEEPTRSWFTMLRFFKAQLFQPDSILNQPLVGMPFVDSLVCGFLFAADHRYREAVAESPLAAAPRQIQPAVDLIETRPDLPLTVTALAAHCHVSVRTIQDSFRRNLGMSPMAYLREVRLRRAHQTLLQSDPSTTTVTSIATRWGFTHCGRFSAAYRVRYGETPVTTLHRS